MFWALKLKNRFYAAITASLAIICAVYIGYATSTSAHLCNNREISEFNIIREVNANEDDLSKKVVYLTFDDGPSAVTEQVLDVLLKEDVCASFFVMGDKCHEKYLPLLSRTIAQGNLVALHSFAHEYSQIYKSDKAFWEDISALRIKLEPYVDDIPNILRFPGGSTNTVSRKYGGREIMNVLKQEATDNGYKYVDWNVCANDAVGGHPSAKQIFNTVTKQSEGISTCVVLFHDTNNTKTTAEALPDIIKYFKDKGYRFDTVDHLDKQI